MPHKSEAFLFQQNATLRNIDICIFKYATHNLLCSITNKQNLLRFKINVFPKKNLFEDNEQRNA